MSWPNSTSLSYALNCNNITSGQNTQIILQNGYYYVDNPNEDPITSVGNPQGPRDSDATDAILGLRSFLLSRIPTATRIISDVNYGSITVRPGAYAYVTDLMNQLLIGELNFFR